MLTCRLPGLQHRSPVRVILDRRLRLPLDSRLARSAAEQPVWLFSSAGDGTAARLLGLKGVTLFSTTGQDSTTALLHVLETLAEQGITRVLVEGGATLATAFLRAGMVDLLYQFAAPMLIGADGYPATHSLAVTRLANIPRWRRVDGRLLEADRLDVLEPVPRAG
jgi:diaminohydroxyphosphoribosylaminopyrimidine deaminase/5-amino-6-(5-phosphoribosylamino)uracil reductase